MSEMIIPKVSFHLSSAVWSALKQRYDGESDLVVLSRVIDIHEGKADPIFVRDESGEHRIDIVQAEGTPNDVIVLYSSDVTPV